MLFLDIHHNQGVISPMFAPSPCIFPMLKYFQCIATYACTFLKHSTVLAPFPYIFASHAPLPSIFNQACTFPIYFFPMLAFFLCIFFHACTLPMYFFSLDFTFLMYFAQACTFALYFTHIQTFPVYFHPCMHIFYIVSPMLVQ